MGEVPPALIVPIRLLPQGGIRLGAAWGGGLGAYSMAHVRGVCSFFFFFLLFLSFPVPFSALSFGSFRTCAGETLPKIFAGDFPGDRQSGNFVEDPAMHCFPARFGPFSGIRCIVCDTPLPMTNFPADSRRFRVIEFSCIMRAHFMSDFPRIFLGTG